MWVYAGDDLEPRLRLKSSEGFWLDYWLFLHADETHSIWRCRPIGLASLARIAQNLHPSLDRILLRAVCEELDGYRCLAEYFDVPPPTSPAATKIGREWTLTHYWQEWLQRFEDISPISLLVSNLSRGLTEAVEASDLPTVTLLTGRLSSELSDSSTSRRQLLQKAKHLFLRERAGCFADGLAALINPSVRSNFIVTFNVGEVPISGQIARIKFKSKRLVTEKTEGPGYGVHGSRRLTAIEVEVSSTDPERAAADALLDCRDLLHQLRVRFYVRAHLIDPIHVQGGEEQSVYLALDQPFGGRGRNTGRIALKLPPKFNALIKYLDAENQARWTAMRWHVSQAISHWPEDVHSAASAVWQAVESFAGGVTTVEQAVVDKYANLLPSELLEYLANRVGHQRYHHRRTTGVCDWYLRDHAKVSLDKWLGQILDEGSINHHSRWSEPAPPLLLFDRGVGLIATMARHFRGCEHAAWLRRRLKLDFDHLYGLRNSVVHKGMRVGTNRWARYLARTGLESVLAVAQSEATGIPSHASPPSMLSTVELNSKEQP